MASTIVGCFENAQEAREVERELIAAGLNRDAVHITAQERAEATQDEPGFWESLKETFGFADEEDRSTYGEAARRGSAIVSVQAPEKSTDRVVDVMRRHHAVDLDQRAAQWRQQGWTGYQPSAQTSGRANIAARDEAARSKATGGAAEKAQGKEVIPVVEEELRVGKRQVQQGGVRVYSHVTQRPVEQQVNLRQERVSVERRPADRPISDADRAFQERTIEARQMGEEAVVDKKARVVEEVVVNKDVQQQKQTVRDNVRRTDVDVQKIPGQSGADFPDAFITELAGDQRYRGRDWQMMEPDVRSTFEKRYPERKWDEFRDRIRSGYERMRARA
jgi:uncharacterized protein (TIGR02271 family)